jgi:hypothetical protein
MELLSEMSFEKLRELGLIDESCYRNLTIRRRFDELKAQGFKTTMIKLILGEEFCLSPESIHGIYYRKTKVYRYVN